MPEVPAPPDDELVAGQYADRPQLRPVLEAILALLPALGEVTVQARKTCVSLVGPRRTFAVVQATTRSRVDLGLRLEGAVPAGRLLAAKHMTGGSPTVRVALTGPAEVDDDVADLLRRAYEQNAAPPRRRPSTGRRRYTPAGELAVLIDGFDLPGQTCNPAPEHGPYQNVHVALTTGDMSRPGLVVPGSPWHAAEPVRADAESARWELSVTVRESEDGLDFGGRHVRGDASDRHLGLAWGEVPGDGTLRLFRGAKLRLVDVDPALIRDALRPGYRLVARIRLTDDRGNPVCARVHPPALTWHTERRG
jgi:Family of unknown function (DUF5990)/Domain of unknown function (DUF5655)